MEKEKLYMLISSDGWGQDSFDKTICICDEKHLKGCIKEILMNKKCSEQAIALYIKKALIGNHDWNQVYHNTQPNGDDFDYDTRDADFTLRIDEISLNEVKTY